MANKAIRLKDDEGNKVYVSPYYPVGSIYLSVNNTNPQVFFSGTWVEFGKGRVLVGVDTTQTEFATVEQTGGSKTQTLSVANLPSHDHVQQYGKLPWTDSNGTGSNASGYRPTYQGELYAKQCKTTTTGSGTAHNNLQPYITCYMWKRTA